MSVPSEDPRRNNAALLNNTGDPLSCLTSYARLKVDVSLLPCVTARPAPNEPVHPGGGGGGAAGCWAKVKDGGRAAQTTAALTRRRSVGIP